MHSSKHWVKVAFFVSIVAITLVTAYLLLQPEPNTAWKLQTDSVIGQRENPHHQNWILLKNNRLFFTTTAGQIVAADQKTGKILWLRQTDANTPFAPFLLDEKTIGILTITSEVFAFDATTGATKWIYEPELMAQPDTPPVVDGTQLYFGDRTGKLTALDITTGRPNWEQQFKAIDATRSQSSESPLIHFGLLNQSQDLLIINHSPELALITVDKKTGRRLQTRPLSKFSFQTPEIAQDGRPILSDTKAPITNDGFTLCGNQTAVCSNTKSLENPHIISLEKAAFAQKQKTAFKQFLPKLTQPLNVTSAPKTVAANQPLDWEFEFSDLSVNNIWTEVDAKLSIEEKSQRQKITVTAYPLNHRRWRATVKLPTAGEWHWRLHVTSPTKKHIASGKLTVAPEKLPEVFSWPGLGFQDAFIDMNSNDDYFDQHFIGATQQPPRNFETFKIVDWHEYLEHYADPATGFTALRWSVDNFSFPLWREISDKNFQLNLKGGQNGDKLVRSIAEKKLSLDLDVFGFKPPFVTEQKLSKQQKKQLERYLSYMIGRYGAFVTSWEIGNEVTPSDDWIREVAALLKKLDPYQHPVSINWERDQQLGLDFTSLHHYFSIDPHAAQGEFLSMIEPYKNTHQAIVFSELGNANASWDAESADRFRIRIWTAFMSQTPVFFWAQNGPLFLNPGNNANVYLGPTERTAIKNFRILTQSQSQEWISVPANGDTRQVSALALHNKDTLWIYVTNTQANTWTTGSITIPNTKTSYVEWYDPATGRKIGTTNNLKTPRFKHDIVGITKKEP